MINKHLFLGWLMPDTTPAGLTDKTIFTMKKGVRNEL